jgi:hypothetical protein
LGRAPFGTDDGRSHVLETADVPPTMIVGVHGLSDDNERLQEYSPVFDEGRFAAHEEFFVENVRACDGPSPSGHLRRGLLGVAGRRL